MYMLYVVVLDADMIKKIEKQIYNFLWNNSFQPLSRKILRNNELNGGWKIWDLSILGNALKMSVMMNSLQTKDHSVWYLAQYVLGSIAKMITRIEGSFPFIVNANKRYKKWRRDIDKVLNEKPQWIESNVKMRPGSIYGILYEQFENDRMRASVYDWKKVWLNVSVLPAEWREISWRLLQIIIMNKEYLRTHHGGRDENCPRCGDKESNLHLFWVCPTVISV
ncbi:uncharacterized protein LOC111615683 [Centruroides sculpturatus]|uniref:uncharacterized protein LOC111615683 n=1 Tax=Centruroides sculpturatus TaxID=218467 RepID=UPI000C6CDB04|nr:uncharacterized protein LOC111615683 [Centruroides sculpturatus]